MGMVPSLNKLSFYQGRDFLTFVSDMCDISLTIGGCLMCIFITYKWKIENMNEELSLGNPTYIGSFLQKYINFTITVVCPILLSILSVLVIIDKFFGIDKVFG
jgi:NSS family neurotransmitter:Na+ symporter